MKSLLHLVCFGFAVLLLSSCASDTNSIVTFPCEPENTAATYELLFVGNSLSFTNNLPELVKAAAAEVGVLIST